MIQVPDSHDKKRTIILQIVLVMNMFSSLRAPTHSVDNAFTPLERPRRTPQVPTAVVTPWQRINTNDRVQLNAVIVAVSAASVPYSLLWSCATLNLNMTSASLATSVTEPSLVIVPNVLRSGVTYTFVLFFLTLTNRYIS